MKKIILSITLLSSIVSADLSVQQIQKMVLKIHEKREGINLSKLENTKEPFVHIKEDSNETAYVAPDKIEVKLSLHAILNHKAYINDTWIGIDDSIMGYKLKYIGRKGVVLRNENDIKKLFLHENKENYISIEEKE